MGSNIKFKAACSREVGRSHISTNTPCQDYISVQRSTLKGIVSISLSDGAGSCSLSHIGSRIIVKTTNSFIVEKFEKIVKNELSIEVAKSELINQINNKFVDRFSKDNVDSIKNYSGTLLAVATNGEKFIVIHLGDGVIGCVKNGTTKVLSAPSNGEFSNTTYFVTDKDAVEKITLINGDLEDISSFILMSDGTQDSLYCKKDNSLAPACLTLTEWLNNNTEKKTSRILRENAKKIFTQKSTDDCSIGILNIIKNI
ncbi:PP2C family serine/threonine-protein phosphatase [Aliarcobacter cryaerophilus]|uniref:PP2C family serine/threonine-protein phosphatase n=1 Tax=Aliarcobacter cryaerophilus TaxID=28198 RepID=UPI003DA46875